ncbi:hypothetical protein ABEB36_000540 [Hypothenemus hampei]|uniref:MADF domain-containing protein n=1 Tax=Hypothenemus hampei TaxID=57062 RepID=A0ABD1FBL0_HYPHA
MAQIKCWSEEETFSLISYWKMYPELWNVNNINYRNRAKKENALKELAAKFDTIESEISRKLHNLRTQFHQGKRRKKTNKDGDEYQITWKFYDAMKFISNDHSTSGNFEPPKQMEILANEHDNSNDDIKIDVQPRKRKPGHIKKNNRQHEVIFKKTSNLLNKRSDQFQIFGDFVASELRNLKSWDYQRQLKLTIQRAIVQYSELDLSSPSTSEDRNPLYSNSKQFNTNHETETVASYQQFNITIYKFMSLLLFILLGYRVYRNY